LTRCEQVFDVIKNLWGFTKVRYRGLAKNTVPALVVFALATLYQVRNNLHLQST